MPITPDISSANSFLANLQAIISRMTTYSSNCKQFCVTLVSAILVISFNKERPEAIFVGFMAVFVFLFLDAYYLSIERDFRKIYDSFVEELHAGTADTTVFTIELPNERGHRMRDTFKALLSFSVFGFYGVIALAIFAVKIYIQSLPPGS